MYRQPTATRAEILEATGLNPASLSHCLKRLIDAGLVLRVGELGAKAGRPADLLRLNSEAGYFVVVDLEASPIRFAVSNLLGEIRYRWEEGDPAKAMEVSVIKRGVDMVCSPLSAPEREAVLAISICRPGIVDAEGRVTSVNLGWERFPFGEKVREVLDKPVFVENAGRSYLLAEHWFGAAAGVRDCIFVEVGKGVGGAIFSRGEFFQGRTQAEFGHITVEPGAPDLCRCGKAGCMEAIASASNVVRQYLDRVGRPGQAVPLFTVNEVIDRARRGDPHALAVIDRAVRALGLGLSYLLAIFNPEVFVVGGYFLGSEDFLLPRLRAELVLHTREWSGSCRVVPCATGSDIGLRGAAALAFYRVLEDPDLLRRLSEPRTPRTRKARE